MSPFQDMPEDYDEKYSNENVFDSTEWLESVEYYLFMDNARSDRHRFFVEHYLSPVLYLIISESKNKEKLSVIDFGGGVGNTYLPIIKKLNKPQSIDYHIIDSEKNINQGMAIFSSNEIKPIFHKEIPKDIHADIIIASSVIQYVSDYSQIIHCLCALKAKYIYLTRTLTTENETFCVQQNITISYGPHNGKFIGSTKCVFINRNQLIDIFLQNGYVIESDLFYSDYSRSLSETSYGDTDCSLRTMLFYRAETEA